ncbi:MAG: hypothetical protein E2O77_05545 [Caldithrix sp.]|nr:MAG: hypothetical protein E2O77_05545 [Caldithrix sp.]
MLNLNNQKIAGGNSVSVDLGLLFKWQQLDLEAVILDVNTPKLSDSDVLTAMVLLSADVSQTGPA